MKKEQKDTIINALGEQLTRYPHFYIVDVTGLNAASTGELRRKCFKSDLKMVVVKNTLLHKVLTRSQVDFEPLYATLRGNTAIIFTNVANAPAKLLKGYAKQGVPALKGAYAEESIFIGADKLQALLSIKSKNELIADIVAQLLAPTHNVVSALQSGASIIHGVLTTLGERAE